MNNSPPLTSNSTHSTIPDSFAPATSHSRSFCTRKDRVRTYTPPRIHSEMEQLRMCSPTPSKESLSLSELGGRLSLGNRGTVAVGGHWVIRHRSVNLRYRSVSIHRSSPPICLHPPFQPDSLLPSQQG
jgi:hypothetical protein